MALPNKIPWGTNERKAEFEPMVESCSTRLPQPQPSPVVAFENCAEKYLLRKNESNLCNDMRFLFPKDQIFAGNIVDDGHDDIRNQFPQQAVPL